MIHESRDPRHLNIDQRELSARLGVPIGAQIDGYCELYDLLLSAAKPMYSAVYVNLDKQNDGITIGKCHTESRGLSEVVKDSDECILLAATLGIGVDRLIIRMASTSPRDAFVIDAMADAMIEAVCDMAEERLTAGLETAPRFSPGYADLELSFAKEILALTDAERLIGIKLSESGLMLPKKSVNAIIAIKNGKKND